MGIRKHRIQPKKEMKVVIHRMVGNNSGNSCVSGIERNSEFQKPNSRQMNISNIYVTLYILFIHLLCTYPYLNPTYVINSVRTFFGILSTAVFQTSKTMFAIYLVLNKISLINKKKIFFVRSTNFSVRSTECNWQ